MATIEERKKNVIRKNYDCEVPCLCFDDCKFGNGVKNSYDCGACGADEFERGYLKGANEQKQIDIDKACEWFKSELGSSKSSAFWVLNLGVDRLISAFREAMTKEE